MNDLQSVDTDPLRTDDEVCAQLRIARRTLRLMRTNGQAPVSFRLGGGWRTRQSAIDAYVTELEGGN